MNKKKLILTLCVTLSLAACNSLPILQHYNGRIDNGHVISSVDDGKINQEYQRQVVLYPNSYKKGTVIVDTEKHFLYVTLSEAAATRYGISTPAVDDLWYGKVHVKYKKIWPTWTPTASMIEKDPEYGYYASGMSPGINNPLGARALYLFENDRDTFYRIHGTSEFWTIGAANSSGCFRMLNEDVIDLYDKVPVGADVFVLKPSRSK